nr:aldo/keto reductase [uncultured Lichenicoccus sp.]
MSGIRQARLSCGVDVPVLGQGTWNIGDSRAARDSEIRALRLGLDLGMTLIDTAEMYGNGASERLVGEAIEGRRDEVFLVSKVLPSNATRPGIARSCRDSLKRLGTDRLDLYLLHWRGGVALGETIDAFEILRREGLILQWGVSNFDVDDMAEFVGRVRPGGCLVNQVLYNLEHRGIEHDMIQYGVEQNVRLMAYSPVGQGGALLRHQVLQTIAARHGSSPAQIALAWTIRHRGVISIPKSGNAAHVRENAAAAAITLQPEDLAELDVAFPPPKRKVPLAML